jgi:hypothetical protein
VFGVGKLFIKIRLGHENIIKKGKDFRLYALDEITMIGTPPTPVFELTSISISKPIH